MKNKGVLLFIILLTAGFIGVVGNLYLDTIEAPVEVELAKPEIRDIVKKTVATGSITPRREVEVKPQISGIIETVHVEPGQVVKKGDLMVTIRVVPDVVRLNEAEAQVRAAKLNERNAKAEFERFSKLKEVVSESEFAKQELAYELRQQELRARQSHLQLVREGVAARLIRSVQPGPSHHGRNGSQCARQRRCVGDREQRVQRRHHHRDPGRYDRYGLHRMAG